MEKTYRFLGLMSGSSLDGLDLACCLFRIREESGMPVVTHWELVHADTLPFSGAWKERLQTAPLLSGLELSRTHAAFGRYLGELAGRFLEEHGLHPDGIASHGHTVFHFPGEGFTLQIGDGGALSACTGLPVVSDFRAQDIALGGQGAPLAPLADRLLFPEYHFCLNIGGIANLSARTEDGRYVAFDVGGANQILNALVQPLGLEYDRGGQLAARGHLIEPLQQQMDQLPFFGKPYPKSLGNDWVQEQQVKVYLAHPGTPEDKLHTACLQLAGQVAVHLKRVFRQEAIAPSPSYRLLVTGGGAFNDFLVNSIREALDRENLQVAVIVPSPEIVSFKEAILMALMGALRMAGLTNSLASVTGASRDLSAGAVWLGSNQLSEHPGFTGQ